MKGSRRLLALAVLLVGVAWPAAALEPASCSTWTLRGIHPAMTMDEVRKTLGSPSRDADGAALYRYADASWLMVTETGESGLSLLASFPSASPSEVRDALTARLGTHDGGLDPLWRSDRCGLMALMQQSAFGTTTVQLRPLRGPFPPNEGSPLAIVAIPAREPSEVGRHLFSAPTVDRVAPAEESLLRRGGVVFPVLNRSAPLVWPERGRLARAEARVVVQALVAADGSIAHAEAVHCNRPDLDFESAAVAAVKRYQYVPATHWGRPIDAYVMVEVVYAIHPG